MECHCLSFAELSSFSPLFKDYVDKEEQVSPFYKFPPTPEGLLSAAKSKKFLTSSRKVLVQVLKKQYEGIDNTEAVEKNINLLLQENTFTITTGHQLNLCTGPAYFAYKILAVTEACRKMAKQYPDFNFVPVYWMATEDHDIEEIDHFNIGDRTVRWESGQSGAVGHLSTSGIPGLLKEIPSLPDYVREAYSEENYARATRLLVHEMFGQDGLVILDPDEKELKELAEPLFKKELTEEFSGKAVSDTSEKLAALGYKTQASERQINLFYIGDGFRERIVKDKESFRVLGKDITFGKDDISSLVGNLSPNVILRPLFQEIVLPNICYSGGPAEISYWLQLKDVFEEYDLQMPALLPRAFFLYLDRVHSRKLDKTGFPLEKLFLNEPDVRKEVLEVIKADYRLDTEKAELSKLFERIKNKAEAVDMSLSDHTGAVARRAEKMLEYLETRIRRSQEENYATLIRQVMEVRKYIYPGDALQERKENIFTFLSLNADFMKEAKKAVDPFNLCVKVLKEDV